MVGGGTGGDCPGTAEESGESSGEGDVRGRAAIGVGRRTGKSVNSSIRRWVIMSSSKDTKGFVCVVRGGAGEGGLLSG